MHAASQRCFSRQIKLDEIRAYETPLMDWRDLFFDLKISYRKENNDNTLTQGLYYIPIDQDDKKEITFCGWLS